MASYRRGPRPACVPSPTYLADIQHIVIVHLAGSLRLLIEGGHWYTALFYDGLGCPNAQLEGNNRNHVSLTILIRAVFFRRRVRCGYALAFPSSSAAYYSGCMVEISSRPTSPYDREAWVDPTLHKFVLK